MDEDNIFESHEFEAKADFENGTGKTCWKNLSDYEIPEERLSELACSGWWLSVPGTAFPRTALSEFDG